MDSKRNGIYPTTSVARGELSTCRPNFTSYIVYSPQRYRSDSRSNSGSYYRILTKLVSMEMSRGGYSPQLYRSDSRSKSGSYRIFTKLVSMGCLKETGLFSSRHFHRHQFCEDPIITPRLRATVRSIKLRTVYKH
ncbi:hypothetical protein AVEN_233368-1 [Araneus ventricosus]|uniref:Uncharacterized protein n=1 Tax=Araneus ventricosus TaxID=182803 RepID=A0A4Y2HG58_ARAVE|nr:hypothetical protein AVEN_233368-1 [Araneus ventricosus]